MNLKIAAVAGSALVAAAALVTHRWWWQHQTDTFPAESGWSPIPEALAGI